MFRITGIVDKQNKMEEESRMKPEINPEMEEASKMNLEMKELTRMNGIPRCSLNIAFYQDGKIYRKCPSCKQIKEMSDFGYRQMNNIVTNQSWCAKCRAEAASNHKEAVCA